MSDAALILHHISRRYTQGETSLTVLDDADLTVRKGEMVALVGPSGSGKTTLLQIAGLLAKPDSGAVTIAGTDYSTASDGKRTRARLKHLGFVYQFHHLLPEFTALENVTMPQLIAGVNERQARTRAQELLTLLGLDARMTHLPSMLSGGEQQRVAIARAMANEPTLIIADEPTGNLDPHTADQVFSIFSKLVKESGVGALIATHNLELAGRMDRMVKLSNGKIF